tara:strand:+ start:1745 stop:1966 length:222 start_codon:yes stop_codon:yes gene_type:complete
MWILSPSLRDNYFWLSIPLDFLSEDELQKLLSSKVIYPRNNWGINDTELYLEFSTEKQGIAFIKRAKKALAEE